MPDHAVAASTPRVERFDTVIIGAGQAGLATGYHLMRRDADFVILDGAARPGESWRNRWDSLRLFTPARYSGLPGMPFPAPPSHLPDKDEVADYLDRYAARFDLPVRGNARVDELGWNGTRFTLTVAGRRIEASQVVVATGAFVQPVIPELGTRLDPAIHQMASVDYRNPFDLPDGPVLVVGAGNSGAQIALEIARYRKVWLAGRDTGLLPRQLLGVDVFHWLWPFISGIHLDSAIGRQMTRRIHGGDALIGITRHHLHQAGVARVGRVDGVAGGMPRCGDDVLEPRVVIWCTGLRPAHDWIRLPVFDASGMPVHLNGSAPAAPGLHFVGLRLQRRVASSLIGGAAADAEVIARAVKRGLGEG